MDAGAKLRGALASLRGVRRNKGAVGTRGRDGSLAEAPYCALLRPIAPYGLYLLSDEPMATGSAGRSRLWPN